MLNEVLKVGGAYLAARGENPHSLAIMEGHTNCNRACVYCNVHNRKSPKRFSTVAESEGQIDDIYDLGYRFFQYVGGESLGECQRKGELNYRRRHRCEYGVAVCGFVEAEKYEEEARFRTEEDLTYVEHALRLVGYASRKRMLTNVITNGDFLKPERGIWILRDLKAAGLDFLTFSLHSPSEAGIQDIIGKARATAREGIIPTVSMVFTADRGQDLISQVAKLCTRNGVFFSTSIVQEIGKGFSAVPEKSQIPTIEQTEKVFEHLRQLKKGGFIINSSGYLTEAARYSGNSWKCDPEKDAVIHVRAQGERGEVGVCSEMRTGFQTGEVSFASPAWREWKRRLVEGCPGCRYACFFRSENSDFKGDLKGLLPMIFIKSGNWELARMLGERMVKKTEVISVPQTELERVQARLRDENSLVNRTRKAASVSLNYISFPLVVGVVLAYFAAYSMSDYVKGKIKHSKS